MSMRPCMIAIAGPSGSGKTTLARELALLLGGPGRCACISLDNYYRDLSHLDFAARVCTNFDAPESIESELLHAHLTDLAGGMGIDQPQYDFARHVRRREVARLEPREFVVVEGILALCWKEINPLYHARVYVDLHPDACFTRRLCRDVAERGRSLEQVRTQWEETVLPMCRAHVLPGRLQADIVVSGDAAVESSAETVLSFLSGVSKL